MSNNKKTILIIEDEKILLDVLSKKIKDENFNVITAKDGEDGLAKIKKNKPDLILLDMLLPKVDGYEVLKSMKKDGINTPVVIVSNSGQPVDIDRAIKLGACDYLIKTEFEPKEVIDKIRSCLIIKQDNGLVKHDSKVILVIEDDKFLRDLCIKQFSQMGFQVDFSGDGVEGMRKIINNKPDLVLLDIIIPGIEGFELLRKVRAHEDKLVARIPIIVLSNLGQETDIEKAKSLGANDYLIKAHFSIEDIANKVKKYL